METKIAQDEVQKWFEVRPSPIQGLGVFALRPIPKGTRIVEYIGERITHQEANARYDDAAMERHHTFLFTVDEQTVIDATRWGNDSRYFNHSCDPNCEPIVDEGRIFIEAICDIGAGAELLFDYSYERENESPEAEKLYGCHCGAKHCRKTILAPVDADPQPANP